MSQSSTQWWKSVKKDGEKLVEWLKNQYHGEVTAADRIERYCSSRAPEEWKETLAKIAMQERMHAVWVGELLKRRGHEPKVLEKNERYWNETLGQIEDFETACAVAAHAEDMRLRRIEVISTDMKGPADVRNVFKRILRDERFHAKAFAKMAGPAALADTKSAHEKGMEAIGLVTFAEAGA